VGDTYLLASQCARLGQQPAEEERLRQQSILFLRKAVEGEEVPEDSLYRVTYLLGELNRRSGDTWQAKEWFQKVLKIDLGHGSRDFFRDLAQRQMEKPRDMIGDETMEEKQMIKGEGLPEFLGRLFAGKKRT
jgi:hypothetical protein